MQYMSFYLSHVKLLLLSKSVTAGLGLRGLYRVTVFLEFLETWKFQGQIWVKASEKSGKGPKSAKGQGIFVVGEIWLWQLNSITYLYLIRTVIHLLIRDVHGEFGLINAHLFDILHTISSRKAGEKSRAFIYLESGNPVCELNVKVKCVCHAVMSHLLCRLLHRCNAGPSKPWRLAVGAHRIAAEGGHHLCRLTSRHRCPVARAKQEACRRKTPCMFIRQLNNNNRYWDLAAVRLD